MWTNESKEAAAWAVIDFVFDIAVSIDCSRANRLRNRVRRDVASPVWVAYQLCEIAAPELTVDELEYCAEVWL